MSFFDLFKPKKPDVEELKRRKDIHGLIRALRFRDISVQLEAAQALGTLGPDALKYLHRALGSRNKTVKLGIIGALTEIRSTESIPPLIAALSDENSEVQWQAAIALGEIGDPEATGPLVSAMGAPDKYVRFGAAISLSRIGWKPQDPHERATYLSAMEEWKAIREIGKPAVPALVGLLRDRDAGVRLKAVELLGATGDRSATPALMQSLGDENREVRWGAALAAPRCAIPMKSLPRGLARRPQTVKNPWIAGFLNFLLPGLGYGYIGKWWGTMIFQIDVMVTVWLFKFEGDTNSYALLLPVYILLGAHAWYITAKMPKDPP
ncbi:HEAT repeat domain-containing protein [uncultured Methanoregula sp.]|uniref:HEAT repeat domain-containing protein n=1 Tax=uncultured Methanoregula sp. TaxID=1005933 RepID=UPI002AAAF8D9|nr:HEAT repeat domain-containing protein [uncultured Methanoregula sp.]